MDFVKWASIIALICGYINGLFLSVQSTRPTTLLQTPVFKKYNMHRAIIVSQYIYLKCVLFIFKNLLGFFYLNRWFWLWWSLSPFLLRLRNSLKMFSGVSVLLASSLPPTGVGYLNLLWNIVYRDKCMNCVAN